MNAITTAIKDQAVTKDFDAFDVVRGVPVNYVYARDFN